MSLPKRRFMLKNTTATMMLMRILVSLGSSFPVLPTYPEIWMTSVFIGSSSIVKETSKTSLCRILSFPSAIKIDLDKIATEFLRKHYPEALRTPMPVDPMVLADRLGLSVVTQELTEDFSVFGQIFFQDCDTEVFNSDTGKMEVTHFPAKTIVVDPKAFLLRNLGSVNNTIVHECVHWDQHRKAFELERLYNRDATQIKCLVIGGSKGSSDRTAADWMEWQANCLAPRIQMPIGSFKTKAAEYVRKFQREMNATHIVDVMEPVIDALATFFVVSRHAAKMRMVDAGYEEAIGAFTYIDGHYVKPHAFKKGSLQKDQTYCISADDAQIIAFSDMRLSAQSQKGSYIYVDSHMCLNDPKYVTRDENNTVQMTDYPKFLEKLEVCRDLFHGFDYTTFLTGDDLEKARMISGGVNFLLGKSVAEHDLPDKEKTQNVYIKEALLLKQALSLCGSLVDSKTRMEAAYFEAVRTMLVRLSTGGAAGKKFTLPEVNERINELLKHTIQSEGVINLFSDVGTEFSLFDPKFLEEISRMKEKNLAVELLKKLIAEQVSVYRRTNVVKSEKFSEIIQSAMNRYLNGMLTNEEVIEELLKLAKDIAAANAGGEKLGLSAEELAFYDALTKPQAEPFPKK